MTIYQPINHDHTFEEVAHQIEALILEGVLRPGEHLPGERELAVSLNVSRPVVRQAIQSLHARNILQRRQGDGTFVADVIGQVFAQPIAQTLSHHPRATQDYLEYRREIEAIAAGLAAERTTTDDHELLRKCRERMVLAHDNQDFETEAAVDLEFHTLIGECSHNLILLHTLRSCYRLLAEGIFQNRMRLYAKTGARQDLFNQHLAIIDAVLSGDKHAAAEASTDHINYVLAKSHELEEEAERKRVSHLRRKKRQES